MSEVKMSRKDGYKKLIASLGIAYIVRDSETRMSSLMRPTFFFIHKESDFEEINAAFQEMHEDRKAGRPICGSRCHPPKWPAVIELQEFYNNLPAE